MTEALYEYFEDDFEEFEEEDERVEAINAEIADFERQHGVELSATSGSTSAPRSTSTA